MAPILGVASMLAYLALLWNRPLLATLLPTSSLIIVGNWLPLWASFFVGIYLVSAGRSRIRKGLLSTVAVVMAIYSTVAPMAGQPPECQAVAPINALQYQTTPHTCSAACAASLLQLHGIEATEDELARLCLTREGTHWMGVYRGLTLKTELSEWNVVVEPFSQEALARRIDSPCMLSINLDVSEFSQNVDHGFQDSAGHSVVVLGNGGNGYVTVFDPSPDYGAENWDNSIFECVSDGVIMRLVPSQGNSTGLAAVKRRLLAARLPVSVVGL